MDSNTILIILAVAAAGVGAYFAFNHFKKKNIEKLFLQVYETSRQVPKQKKHSFLLLMFKETMSPENIKTKKNPNPNLNKLNNPKYLEIQLMQMSKILKDNSLAKDKKMKNALKLFNDYLEWEKEKHAKAKEDAAKKVA